MSLTAGTRLGPYEITGLIRAGRMGLGAFGDLRFET